jgi:hypothetical protein
VVEAVAEEHLVVKVHMFVEQEGKTKDSSQRSRGLRREFEAET